MAAMARFKTEQQNGGEGNFFWCFFLDVFLFSCGREGREGRKEGREGRKGGKEGREGWKEWARRCALPRTPLQLF